VKHSVALTNTQADSFATAVDAGATGGKLKLYTGATLGAGTLLSTVVLATTAFGAASAGVVTGASFPRTDSSAAATGTVGHYEITDSADTIVGEGAGVGTSGAEVNLVTLSIVATQPVTINSLTYTRARGT
jgi:hypothetical protein